MPEIWGDRYIFTDQALGAMSRHNITRDKVKRVLNEYSRSEAAGNGLKFYTKIYDNHEVGVLAKKGFLGLGKIVIVSAWNRKYK